MEGIEYYYYGIFISVEEGVIDFGGLNKIDVRVRFVDLFQFIDYGRRRLVRIIYLKNQCLLFEVVVDNVKKLLENL